MFRCEGVVPIHSSAINGISDIMDQNILEGKSSKEIGGQPTHFGDRVIGARS